MPPVHVGVGWQDVGEVQGTMHTNVVLHADGMRNTPLSGRNLEFTHEEQLHHFHVQLVQAGRKYVRLYFRR